MHFPASHTKHTNSSRAVRVAAVLLLAGTLAACGSVDRTGRAFWQPYRPNVQQGNWITQQQVSLLRPGMTREQVRFALGTPTLTPIFHAERWEYPYFLKPGYGDIQERRFTVYFENDLLVRWEGDEQPTVQPFQKAPDPATQPAPLAEAPTAAPAAESGTAAAPGAGTSAAPDESDAPATASDTDTVRNPNVLRELQEAAAHNPAAPQPGGVNPNTGSVPLR